MSLHIPPTKFSNFKFNEKDSSFSDMNFNTPTRTRSVRFQNTHSSTPHLLNHNVQPVMDSPNHSILSAGRSLIGSPNAHNMPRNVNAKINSYDMSISPNSNTHSHRNLSNLGMSIKDRLEYASRFPTIKTKIEAIANICFNEISLKDLANNLQYLLKLIFNLDLIKSSGDTINSKSSFCLNSLYNKQMDYSSISKNVLEDSKIALEFLSPDGILFGKFYEMQKKRIFPKIDNEIEVLLKKFYPEKFAKSGAGQNLKKSDSSNLVNLGGLGNLGSLGSKKLGTEDHPENTNIYDHINPQFSTTNLASPNYINPKSEESQNINQITAFELYFCSFAIYGLCYDKSYEDVINYHCQQFGHNNIHGQNYSMSFLHKYNLMGNNRNDRVYVILLQSYMSHFIPLDLCFPKLIIDKQHGSDTHLPPKSPTNVSNSSISQKFSAIFKPNAFNKSNFDLSSHDRQDRDAKSAATSASIARSSAIVVENVSFIMMLADSMIASLSAVWFNQEFWPGTSGFMLYEEHVRDLRLLIKHILTFVTIDTSQHKSLLSQNSNFNLKKLGSKFSNQAFAKLEQQNELFVPEIISHIQNLQNSIVRVGDFLTHALNNARF